jgi:hypothetical protein
MLNVSFQPEIQIRQNELSDLVRVSVYVLRKSSLHTSGYVIVSTLLLLLLLQVCFSHFSSSQFAADMDLFGLEN